MAGLEEKILNMEEEMKEHKRKLQNSHEVQTCDKKIAELNSAIGIGVVFVVSDVPIVVVVVLLLVGLLIQVIVNNY